MRFSPHIYTPRIDSPRVGIANGSAHIYERIIALDESTTSPTWLRQGVFFSFSFFPKLWFSQTGNHPQGLAKFGYRTKVKVRKCKPNYGKLGLVFAQNSFVCLEIIKKYVVFYVF